MPAVGRGAGQQKAGVLDKTSQTGSVVQLVGEAYHSAWIPAQQLSLVETDADHWKTWVHQRLATPVGNPGAMTFFKPQVAHEHLSFCKHLTAESKVEEFVAGKGVITRWERIRKQNHWLDSTYDACVAGHGVGIRLVEEAAKPAPPPPRDETNVIDPRKYLRGRPKWIDRDRGGWSRW